jgi:hypothetical protein
LVEETGENHRPAACHCLTLSYNVISSTPLLNVVRTHKTSVVIDTDCIGSCTSHYHTVPYCFLYIVSNIMFNAFTNCVLYLYTELNLYNLVIRWTNGRKLSVEWKTKTPLGRYYRLSNFWLAKEVNNELRKEVAASVFIKTIKYCHVLKFFT